MAVHHSSDQLMLALAAQCMQTSLISFDKILISYDTEDGILYVKIADSEKITHGMVGANRVVKDRGLTVSYGQCSDWLQNKRNCPGAGRLSY